MTSKLFVFVAFSKVEKQLFFVAKILVKISEFIHKKFLQNITEKIIRISFMLFYYFLEV